MVTVDLYQEEKDLINFIRLYRSGYPNNKHLLLDIRPLLNEMLRPSWKPNELKK